MIRHVILDLDDTLYSVKSGLDSFFVKRLGEFASSWLGLSWEEFEPLRDGVLKRYGTTLEWLVAEKGFTAVDDYFAYVHPENEADSLVPDPKLRSFLEGLPCRCSVLTNSPFFHADRIIKKLGLDGVFEKVFAVESHGLGFRGKPHASAYYLALDALGLKPEHVLFVDDSPRYVKGFIDLGGIGLLLDENDNHKNFPYGRIKNLQELAQFL